MCGIAGAAWIHPEKRPTDDQLQRMIDVLRHRGPDDAATYRSELQTRTAYGVTPGVALGYRRLAIVDPVGGKQPMSNEDGSVWVVFNGEIYNFPELRRRLEGAGHRFRTRSDTETLVHLYEDEQLDCFRHLNGMFAAAIWDANHRRLVLVRDRLGKKPLVYRHEPGRLLFASELKSLLQIADVPTEPDPAAIDAYLTYQYIPAPLTIYRGISKLSPGHFAVFSDAGLTVQPYWQPNFTEQQDVSSSDAADDIREQLQSAVEYRLRSDVPVGAFLSGGVDSSLIAAMMQQQTPDKVKTFTIGFEEHGYDERPFAAEVARSIGSEHFDAVVTSQDVVDVLPKLIHHFDEPMGDSSAVPTWYLSRLAREHVTVALSGDGGDELFLGYPRYKAVRWAAWIDGWPMARRILASSFWQSLPCSGKQRSRVRQFKRWCEAMALSPVRRYLDWVSIFQEARRAALYSDDFLTRLEGRDPGFYLEQAWKSAHGRDAMTVASAADLTTYLSGDLMTKVDVTSMAHSLEVRHPFLDDRLVEAAFALPAAMKYRNGRGKRILHDAVGELIPRSIWRRRKQGFGIPLDSWLRGPLRPLVEELRGNSSLAASGWFQSSAVATLVEEHLSARHDHSARLWALIVLEQWLRMGKTVPTGTNGG